MTKGLHHETGTSCFCCTFALSAPAFAGAGLTFNNTNTIREELASPSEMPRKHGRAEPCRSRDGYHRAPG